VRKSTRKEKKVKSKIFSVLFALVLVLSMSLMMAVPAGADPLPPTVSFVTGGTGTAAPTTEKAHLGLGSAKLATISGDDRGMVRFGFAPGQLTLDDLTTLSYWEYVSARENPLDVFIDIWLDFNNDGVATADDYPGYMQAEPYYTVGAAPLNTWTPIDAMSLKWSTYVGPDDPYDAPTIYDFQANASGPCVHGYTMTNWTNGVDFGPLSILRIDIRVGYGGTWANFTGYADDIGINGYTQGFETSVSLTAEVPEIIAISVSPTIINFGTLYPGQSSAVHTITVSNIGTVTVDVGASLSKAPSVFDNLKLDSDTTPPVKGVGTWEITDLAVSGNTNAYTQLVVPPTYSAKGTETATLIFEAEAATP
jgi:hypothetical protein